jgi:hypothetical protein
MYTEEHQVVESHVSISNQQNICQHSWSPALDMKLERAQNTLL